MHSSVFAAVKPTLFARLAFVGAFAVACVGVTFGQMAGTPAAERVPAPVPVAPAAATASTRTAPQANTGTFKPDAVLPSDGLTTKPLTSLCSTTKFDEEQFRRSDWYTNAMHVIEEDQFAIRPMGDAGAFGSVNISNCISTEYWPNRVITHDARAGLAGMPSDHGKWDLTWVTTSFGKESAMQEARTAKLSRKGGRVVYDRGPMVEIYDNGMAGLEQTFVIGSRPQGEGRLVVEGRLTTDELMATFNEASDSIDFTYDDGSVVSYAISYCDMVAFDANMTSLPCRLAFDGINVRLIVDDTHAVYPVSIDPYVASQFGYDGLADASGSSATAQPVLMGCSVATGDFNGDGYGDVAVGAPGFSASPALLWNGKVYVFYGSDIGPNFQAGVVGYIDPWTFEGQGTSTSGDGASFTGQSLAAGDFNGDGRSDLVVASPFHFDPTNLSAGFQTGVVRVFHGSATGLPAPTGTPANPVPNTFIWGESTNPYGTQLHGGLGTSMAAGKLNSDAYDDLALSDSDVTSGKSYKANSSTGSLWSGRVSVIYGSATGLALVGGSGTPLTGTIPGCASNTFVMSNRDTAGINGRAFGFCPISLIGSLNQVEQQHCIAIGDVSGDGNNDLAVGCIGWDVTLGEAGACFVFFGAAAGFGAPVQRDEGAAGWNAKVTSATVMRFGASVAIGHVGGTATADIAVGAPRYGNGQANEGAVFVWFGPVSTLGTASPGGGNANWRVETDTINQGGIFSPATPPYTTQRNGFGGNVGIMDITGDGQRDMVIGGRFYSSNNGAIFAWQGPISPGGTNISTANVFRSTPGNQPINPGGPLFGEAFAAIQAKTSAPADTSIYFFVGAPGRGGSSTGGPGRLWFFYSGIHCYIDTTYLATNPLPDLPEGSSGGDVAKSVFNPLGTGVPGINTVTLDGVAPAGGVTAQWATQDGTAVSVVSVPTALPGEPDFTASSGTMIFSAGQVHPTLASLPMVPIREDTTYELNETFNIFLGVIVPGLRTTPTTITITIANDVLGGDDLPPVADLADDLVINGGTIQTAFSFDESAGPPEPPAGTAFTYNVYVRLQTLSAVPAQLTWETQEQPQPVSGPRQHYATPHTDTTGYAHDFTKVPSGSVTVLPGQTEAFFTIEILSDLIDEYDETFKLIITSSGTCTINAGTGTPATREYICTVVDDDSPPVATWEFSAYTVNEGNSPQSYVTATVKLLDPDYTNFPDTSRASEKSITVGLRNDNIGTSINEQPQAAEDTTMVPLWGNSPDYFTEVAALPFDYEGATSSSPLSPNVTTATKTWTIYGDTIYEVDEVLLIKVDLLASQNVATNPLVGPDEATITITNDDPLPQVEFDVGQTNVNEANVIVTIGVHWSGEHERYFGENGIYDANDIYHGSPCTVNIRAETGTATGGDGPTQGPNEDYIHILAADNVKLYLPPKILTTSFDIEIWDDNLNEAIETIDLAMTNAADIQMGAQITATIYILDNDSNAVPIISFVYSFIDVQEDVGIAVVQLQLTNALGQPQPSGQAVRINCVTSDGTATAPSDYNTQSLVVTFNPGQTLRTFTIPIINDGITETTEYIVLTLSGEIAGTLGNPSAMTVNILDNEAQPILQFKRAAYGVSEAGIAATIYVTTSIQSALPLTVQYYSAGDTAAPDLDYHDVAGTLTFPAGSTEQIFTVPILNDTLIEQNETIVLTLANPVNATLGSLSTAVLTIFNDESGGTGGGGGVTKGGSSCAVMESANGGTSAWIAMAAVLTLLGVLRLARRREA